MTEMSREKAERVVRETTENAIAVMRHFISGAEVQVKYKDPGCDDPVGWMDAVCPVWDWFECEYRIKPKPREFWLYRDDSDDDYGASYLEPVLEWREKLKVREIVE